MNDTFNTWVKVVSPFCIATPSTLPAIKPEPIICVSGSVVGTSKTGITTSVLIRSRLGPCETSVSRTNG